MQSLEKVVEQAQPEVVLHLGAQPCVEATETLGHLVYQCARQPPCVGSPQIFAAPMCRGNGDTDKVYANREWDYGYREEDRLGGHDYIQRQ